MNVLDIVVLVLLAGAGLNGLRSGFVLQVTHLIGLILALIIAFRFSPAVAAGLGEWIPLSGDTSDAMLLFGLLPVDTFLYRLAAFVLLFFSVRFLVRLAAGVLQQVVSLPVLNTFNRVAGVVLSLLQTGLILFIVVNVLNLIPGKMQDLLQQSLIVSWMLAQTPILTDRISEWLLSGDA